MTEREAIRRNKEAECSKPWTRDEVFQVTYFCNIKREYDKVTRWIREEYSPYVGHGNFELNIALARWLNWPETLRKVGYLDTTKRTFGDVERALNFMQGKVFGNAYVVSTNGLAMAKAHYLCTVLLPAAHGCFGGSGDWRWQHTSLASAFKSLVRVHGLGSFMAGQLLADLKNTVNHPLTQADDWWDFVVPGPGSIRGVNWIMNGNADRRGFSDFGEAIESIREMLLTVGSKEVQELCNQDLQNCLCEFDKYCRVLTGTGKSKRSYNGY